MVVGPGIPGVDLVEDSDETPGYTITGTGGRTTPDADDPRLVSNIEDDQDENDSGGGQNPVGGVLDLVEGAASTGASVAADVGDAAQEQQQSGIDMQTLAIGVAVAIGAIYTIRRET